MQTNYTVIRAHSSVGASSESFTTHSARKRYQSNRKSFETDDEPYGLLSDLDRAVAIALWPILQSRLSATLHTAHYVYAITPDVVLSSVCDHHAEIWAALSSAVDAQRPPNHQGLEKLAELLKSWNDLKIDRWSETSYFLARSLPPAVAERMIATGDDPYLEPSQVLAPILRTLTQPSFNEPDTEALAEFITALDEALRANRFGDLSRYFDDIAASSAPATVLVAALRTTFMMRHMIGGWQRLLNRTRGILEQRGLDAAKILRGLA